MEQRVLLRVLAVIVALVLGLLLASVLGVGPGNAQVSIELRPRVYAPFVVRAAPPMYCYPDLFGGPDVCWPGIPWEGQ